MMQKAQTYKMEDAFFICQLPYPVEQKTQKKKELSLIVLFFFIFLFDKDRVSRGITAIIYIFNKKLAQIKSR